MIEDGLSKYIRNPRVALSADTNSERNFYHSWKSPGLQTVIPITNNARLTDAVAMAGGLATGVFDGDSVEIANLKDAYLIRNGKILPVNFSKALYEGDMLNNVPLLNGDYIYIPSNLNASVYVLGEVNSPTTIGYKEDLTVLKALAFAHGMNIEHSEDVLIIRGSLVNPKVYKVNIDDILRGEGFDFALAPNDIVFVPKGGLSQYNDVIRKLVPTAAFLNLIAGPFGGANVAISGNSGN